MAKKRKSVFDTDIGKDELNKDAKKVEKEALEPIPDPDEDKSGGKLMHLYVDEGHHKQAKIKSVLRGKKLGEYIEWLIDQDNP